MPDYMDQDNDGDGIPDLIELTAQGAVVAANKLVNAPDTDGDASPTSSTPTPTATASRPQRRRRRHRRRSDPELSRPRLRRRLHPRQDRGLADSDGDQVPDFVDTDSDNDGLTDGRKTRTATASSTLRD